MYIQYILYISFWSYLLLNKSPLEGVQSLQIRENNPVLLKAENKNLNCFGFNNFFITFLQFCGIFLTFYYYFLKQSLSSSVKIACWCARVHLCMRVHKYTAGHTAGDSCIVRGPHVARVCSHHRHLPPCISRCPAPLCSGPVRCSSTLAWRLFVHTLLHACHLYYWWATCCFAANTFKPVAPPRQVRCSSLHASFDICESIRRGQWDEEGKSLTDSLTDWGHHRNCHYAMSQVFVDSICTPALFIMCLSAVCNVAGCEKHTPALWVWCPFELPVTSHPSPCCECHPSLRKSHGT